MTLERHYRELEDTPRCEACGRSLDLTRLLALIVSACSPRCAYRLIAGRKA